MAAKSVRVFRVAAGATTRWVLEADGRTHDLSAWLAEHEPALGADLAALFARGFFERTRLGRVLASGALRACAAPGPHAVAVPVDPAQVGKILALGKNFREHAAEFGEQVPEEPLFFNKLPETLVPHGSIVAPPAWYAARFDHEAELCVVVSKGGKSIPAARALEHVGGYTVANDLTLRTLQGSDRDKKYPWFRAKNFDGACPLGPCFVPRDFFDLADARVGARVNGAVRQSASTKDLVVDVAHALEFVSSHLTLAPLDLILMGTPSGVGPLADGDEVVCSVQGIGELATRIARPAAVKA
ncbi:MAG: fumarylacetoacetate hydrolase family protein [Planctomycetes bacterium]|nr:fumarylacetoacetate hydrolase family protein [Planctomycetota bacterium]